MKNRKENEVAFSVFRMAIEKKYQKSVYGLKKRSYDYNNMLSFDLFRKSIMILHVCVQR